MHTFRLREGKYEVGYYNNTTSEFGRLFTVTTLRRAIFAVNHLNGGSLMPKNENEEENEKSQA
jgi:hypothetical protein